MSGKISIRWKKLKGREYRLDINVSKFEGESLNGNRNRKEK